jgi:hypothetical protein
MIRFHCFPKTVHFAPPFLSNCHCISIVSARPLRHRDRKSNGGLPPDFLWGLVESRYFMRLSLMKAAHANMGGAACRKSGSPFFSVPRTLVRTWGTRLVADKTGFYRPASFFLVAGKARVILI